MEEALSLSFVGRQKICDNTSRISSSSQPSSMHSDDSSHGPVIADTSSHISLVNTSLFTSLGVGYDQTLHGNEAHKLKEPAGEARKQIECRHCGQVISHAKNISRHRKVCQQIVTVHPCDHCHASFNRGDNLRKHLREKHGIGQKLACAACCLTFTSKTAFEMHRSICTKTGN